MRTLRATGATLRIEAGEHIESVRKQGRWANLDVLLKYYFKPTAEAQRLANARLDIGIRATWGLATTETDSLSEELNRLRAIVAAQEVEIERYKAAGIELSAPAPIDRDKRRRGMYNAKDIRAACDGANTVYEVARNLGLSGGRHSLARIRRIAAEEGIQLPGGHRGEERDAS